MSQRSVNMVLCSGQSSKHPFLTWLTQNEHPLTCSRVVSFVRQGACAQHRSHGCNGHSCYSPSCSSDLGISHLGMTQRDMEGEEARLAQRSVEVGIKRRKKELNECVAARPDLLEAVIHHYR
eukprot:1190072-Amphidinium_carterae.1